MSVLGGIGVELLGRGAQEFVEAALADVEPLRPLPMALLEALGVVLAEDIVATAPVPAFDVAAVDGYAVRSCDAHTETHALHVIGDLTAASWEPATVSAGASYTVTAGTPVPAGADAVVSSENTDGGLANVRIGHLPRPGDGIRRQGSTVAAGAVLAVAGSRLNAAGIALLAAAGIESVLVSPPPRVIVAATGDELVDRSRLNMPGRVVDADSLGLTAGAREAGAHAHRVGIVPDEDEALRLLVEDHAHHADLLVTTGGTGAGHTDVLRRLFGLNDEVRFLTLPVEPPLVVGYGRVGPGRMPVVCLPGDPAGALLGFELLLRPLLRRLAGAASPFRPRAMVRLSSSIRSLPGIREFRPARLEGGLLTRASGRPVGGPFARPLASGEAFLTGYANAGALLIVDEDTTEVESGAELPALLLGPGVE